METAEDKRSITSAQNGKLGGRPSYIQIFEQYLIERGTPEQQRINLLKEALAPDFKLYSIMKNVAKSYKKRKSEERAYEKFMNRGWEKITKRNPTVT
jgi:hypothetical protein